jgi:hypothetical protein
LPKALAPGEKLEMEACYLLPNGSGRDGWYLELINEMRFWFSSRGTAAAPVKM